MASGTDVTNFRSLSPPNPAIVLRCCKLGSYILSTAKKKNDVHSMNNDEVGTSMIFMM
jgi:hypothetical protein